MFKEELFIKKTPYRKKQIIAVSLLFLSGISLILLETKLILANQEMIRKILINAFEGGFVGGLCDWFAVWKTYNAIENDSLIVADEIGQWVASDLLDKNTLKNQINEVLDSAETNAEIYKLLDTYFDTKENTKKILENLWIKMEPSVIEYIVHYNFSLSEMSLITNASSDQIIINTIKICVGDTLSKISEEQKFKEFIAKIVSQQNAMTKFVSIFINIPSIIKMYGEKLKSGDDSFSENEQFLDEMVTIISMSADKYILSWQSLSTERKTVAVKALITQLRETSLDVAAKYIILHKNHIKASKTLRNYMPVREFFEFIEDKIDDQVPQFIGHKISERLKSQDPKDFRVNIEWKTRNILENIRINGTILGFFLGLLIGVLKYSI
ncbi:MAG TPA: DUF445 family protein [Leptospiraceae bacterium]|nr:DUF445 family protein [Leptospiraceae bacterium]HMX32348.1 DUF445 family protein [Leptospiraceae bacterium]HMY32667.1 DUF445 family protein [Leptospiraceae bacterium]HMZ66041.1 DUF445 family protein [Leptospiraceae bacterium]HNA05414.1 DUF445 family protein [Leptospiraceae bacterium]